ncbi:hypothetical protein AOQ84DRAFT_202034 [Glonium stellatum]|uniref:Uncharacterized protein n=1 Tax=Glonium stellatum TaxID=574774 RepID=A0A8E2JLR0_9PEZI|nr:hypothetical protein AOQ84DRAFT_202034 [Glonium stellatum]
MFKEVWHLFRGCVWTVLSRRSGRVPPTGLFLRGRSRWRRAGGLSVDALLLTYGNIAADAVESGLQCCLKCHKSVALLADWSKRSVARFQPTHPKVLRVPDLATVLQLSWGQNSVLGDGAVEAQEAVLPYIQSWAQFRLLLSLATVHWHRAFV